MFTSFYRNFFVITVFKGMTALIDSQTHYSTNEDPASETAHSLYREFFLPDSYAANMVKVQVSKWLLESYC